MASLPLFVFLFLFLIHHTTRGFHICETTSCAINEPSIQFPFQLIREANQSSRCGYPGFELSCNNKSRTLLNLPNSGDFLVNLIALDDQKLLINDPDDCLPRRFLANFDLTGSPFEISDDYSFVNLTFLNCPSNVTHLHPLRPITCLSTTVDHNHSVVAVLSDPPFSTPWISWCQVISSASIPFPDTEKWLFWMNLNAGIELKWNTPYCGNCVARKGQCGFLEDTGLDIGCSLPSQGEGLTKRDKYGITLGLGIPGILCVMGLVWLWSGKRRQGSIELNVARPSVVTGLDGPTIEKYPMTHIGDSGRLPNSNDNVCSICLCDYQPHDTLRTIPDCNHYFHANCIDGWLKMNATCPLCRKLPRNSSFLPSSSSLSPNSS